MVGMFKKLGSVHLIRFIRTNQLLVNQSLLGCALHMEAFLAVHKINIPMVLLCIEEGFLAFWLLYPELISVGSGG